MNEGKLNIFVCAYPDRYTNQPVATDTSQEDLIPARRNRFRTAKCQI